MMKTKLRISYLVGRRALIAAGIVYAALLAIGIACLADPLFFVNAEHGCYPWSPKKIAFRQGMTLCPGQEAELDIGIQISGPKP